MTNQELEKRVEFIIEQQALFASDIQQLQEVQAQTEQIVARLANVTSVGFKDVTAKIAALVDSQIRLTEAQSQTDDKIRKLTKAQSQTDDKIRKLAVAQSQTDDKIRKLAEAQSQTDDTLKRLIAVVDRYFRKGRNGQTGR